MQIQVIRNPDVSSLQLLVENMANREDVQSLMILACDGNGYNPRQLDPVLKTCSIPVFGGIFPQILYSRECLKKGTVLVGLPFAAKTCHLGEISNNRRDLSNNIESIFRMVDPFAKTLFIFVDGLAQRIDDLIAHVYNHFGSFPNYVGGGAGSMSLRPSPCIITNDGLLEDAAILALVDKKSAVGVAHGWNPVSNAIKVTEARLNKVVSLDWRPAFDVYREIVEKHSGCSFSETSFFDLAKSYPLGIAKLEAEMVVRDPIAEESGQLICVGEVSTGSLIHILHGDINSLVAGAATARQLAEKSLDEGEIPNAMFFADCISRVLFMGSAFELEIAAVEHGIPLFGALTIGEIANNGDACLEFFNKTAVVGLL